MFFVQTSFNKNLIWYFDNLNWVNFDTICDLILLLDGFYHGHYANKIRKIPTTSQNYFSHKYF